MKLIHCSDIHLGASMRTHLSDSKAQKRQDELLATFSHMVDYAINNGVSGVIIAGDLLDTDECNLKTRNFLIDTIKNASGIQFYYLCGNHDENSILLRGEELPTNLNVFGNGWTTFKIEDISITGVTLGTNNFEIYRSLALEPKAFNIVVLHGADIHGRSTDEPDTVNLDLLKNRNIDYLALGHLHTFREGRLDSRGVYAYSGCLEGRGFDECGQKGFILLDISNKTLNAEFIPFSRRMLHEIDVDITGLRTTRDIIERAKNQLNPISPNDLVRINLIGTYTIDTEKHLELISSTLETKYFYFQIRDKSRLALDLSKYFDDVSIAGEFVRQVRRSGLPPETQERVITLGLKALTGEEVKL